MQRFAATLFAIFMLAHALVPGLPTYVCTDGGRSLSPCAPPENEDRRKPRRSGMSATVAS